MCSIYIVAGPPGIGKSTYGELFVPENLEIIKMDEIAEMNKAFHYKLHRELAISKFLNTIKYNLENNIDFAFEVNLGKQHHYEFALDAKHAREGNKLNVILFFTDDLAMCQERAAARFKNGKHEVNPDVLEIMYRNTIPLLKEYFQHIDDLMLVDVSRDQKPTVMAGYVKNEGYIECQGQAPNWIQQEIMPLIRAQELSGNTMAL
ncbi:MAG: hypothetical protein ACHQHN_04425 [Sphingobacteriales bacterium]